MLYLCFFLWASSVAFLCKTRESARRTVSDNCPAAACCGQSDNYDDCEYIDKYNYILYLRLINSPSESLSLPVGTTYMI